MSIVDNECKNCGKPLVQHESGALMHAHYGACNNPEIKT